MKVKIYCDSCFSFMGEKLVNPDRYQQELGGIIKHKDYCKMCQNEFNEKKD